MGRATKQATRNRPGAFSCPGPRGSRRMAAQPARAGLRPAAVLVPIVDRANAAGAVHAAHRTFAVPCRTSLLSRRPRSRGRHDADRTALRETHEEIGLSPTRSRCWVSRSLQHRQHRIYHDAGGGICACRFQAYRQPVRSRRSVRGAAVLSARSRESCAQIGATRGAMRQFQAIEVGGHMIWGATAAIVVALAERLRLR